MVRGNPEPARGDGLQGVTEEADGAGENVFFFVVVVVLR
jgi:hypothetical protein